MAPKPYIVYQRGRSKPVGPSRLLSGQSNDEQDPEYVPPSTRTPIAAARASGGIPKKVVPRVITTFQSDEERTLTITSSRSTSGSERESGSEEAFDSDSTYSIGLDEATASGFEY